MRYDVKRAPPNSMTEGEITPGPVFVRGQGWRSPSSHMSSSSRQESDVENQTPASVDHMEGPALQAELAPNVDDIWPKLFEITRKTLYTQKLSLLRLSKDPSSAFPHFHRNRKQGSS